MPTDKGEEDRWRLRLDNYAANSSLKAVENLLTPLRSRYPTAEEGDFRYLENLADLVRTYLEGADPHQVTEVMITQLEGALQLLTQYLNESCNQDASVTSWNLGLTQGDAVLEALSRWPRLDPERLLEEQESRLLNNERNSINAAAKVQIEVEHSIQNFRDSFKIESDAIKSTLDNLAAAETDLSTRIAGQVELIGQQLPTLQAQITSQREEFVAAEETRRKEYVDQIEALDAARKEALKKVELQSAEQIQDQETRFTELREDIGTKAQETLSKLSSLHGDAQRIVQVISQTGMSGGYQKYANRERDSANLWRRLAVGFGSIATIVLALVVILGHRSTSVPWPVDAGRLLLSASLAGLSTYSARQSSSHRKRAEHASNLELQLASIGPYLEGLPDDQRQEVLKNLAYRFFTEDSINDFEEDDSGPTNWLNAMQFLTPKKS
jgi:hypothetical protein